jgi:hypothetical protein
VAAPHKTVTLFQILDIEGSLSAGVHPAGGRYHPAPEANMNYS